MSLSSGPEIGSNTARRFSPIHRFLCCYKLREIERHINLRTRIKRLMRRTICFSKTEQMHDLVIGLFINRYEFGQAL
jgi:IS1 family transposase